MKTVKSYYNKLKTFIIGAYDEFKKVTWPSREQTIRLTAYVLGVSLGVALFVWGVDVLLKELLSAALVQ